MGESIIELVPESIETIKKQTLQKIPNDFSLAKHQEAQIRLARLEAKSLYEQKQLAAAIEKSQQGRYDLSSDQDDSFSVLVMNWLLENQQEKEAALVAFESVFHGRKSSADHACEIALQKTQNIDNIENKKDSKESNQDKGNRDKSLQNLKDENPQNQKSLNPFWWLVLAEASQNEEMAWVTQDEDNETFFLRHLAKARELQADLPEADLLEAQYLFNEKEDYQAALTLFDQNRKSCSWLWNSDVIEMVIECRIRVFGAKKGLEMPIIEAAQAGWNYNMGGMIGNLESNLEDDEDEESDESNESEKNSKKEEWPEKLVELISTHYYETGLAQFEAFFATGKGKFKDADAHTYSMLCNNLAIQYRFHHSSYEKAIVVHQKGIEASPFAEHYDGLMWCQKKLKKSAEFIAAADDLWHFASNYGYSRHNPISYIDDVTYELSELERSSEIPMWLERLDAFWNALDKDEQEKRNSAYLSCLSVVLAQIARTQPQDALARLELSLIAIQADAKLTTTRRTAWILEKANQFERALSLYQSALSLVEAPYDGHEQEQIDYANQGIRNCKEQLTPIKTKAWWQFWA